ncbi:MAG: NADP-dependent isocitrate dehydrogenase [Gammaproteobacteria bacterium]|jgi:isocitrate dehydrogenase|nr:NADP-dependent isocitrate dehydrogenase [Gammaproteobacteria bacterium]MBT7369549.1 NADP-dependent isocitrate dehydrogenase [Gammaproteobacteria bacterium]
MTESPKIVYTETDEAPRLATYSFLPVIKAFADTVGVDVEIRDISLAGRIIATFPERLKPEQRIPDELAYLGELTQRKEANIIKLPNISASNPQMHETIKELQEQGYDLPNYSEEPATPEEEEYKARYDTIKGSAVNPVLREGNSDRRAAKAVKDFAKKYPHPMGAWSNQSKSHVANMESGDFYGSEKSVIMEKDDSLVIEFEGPSGKTLLAEDVPVENSEVVDAAFMSKKALCAFLEKEIASTEDGVLFSLHLKATMMKVSDPIMFGHCVRAYYKDAFEKHNEVFEQIGVDVNNGIGDAYDKISSLPADQAAGIKADLDACFEKGPDLAMVNSDKGITNLHVPSDIIIDASMPAAIRESGKMWGPDGELHDMKAVIPDRCYAKLYDEAIKHCIEYGAFDPTTMGSVPNVGLMAQKAEEYGSHDTTFEAPADGTMRVIDSKGETLLEHQLGEGDVWRLCRVKDGPIRDWVKLAVTRAKATGVPIVFWLDENRAHDANLIQKVNTYLPEHDLTGIEYHILPVAEAARMSLERARDGKDSISATGNVLRDYLTDLFPILELGTSAKMLSIVPLINGGGLFETGAGGSAPKHVQQFEAEGHLRWDSLGEFLALGASLEHLAASFDNQQAQILADTLNDAIAKFLESNKSPSRKVNEIDNRGSHFYLAMYWAEAMAAQDKDPSLKEKFQTMADTLHSNEDKINEEMLAAQGDPVDVGGYYQPDPEQATKAMRPSQTFNATLDAIMT